MIEVFHVILHAAPSDHLHELSSAYCCLVRILQSYVVCLETACLLRQNRTNRGRVGGCLTVFSAGSMRMLHMISSVFSQFSVVDISCQKRVEAIFVSATIEATVVHRRSDVGQE